MFWNDVFLTGKLFSNPSSDPNKTKGYNGIQKKNNMIVIEYSFFVLLPNNKELYIMWWLLKNYMLKCLQLIINNNWVNGVHFELPSSNGEKW